jgi:hypothetical protein
LSQGPKFLGNNERLEKNFIKKILSQAGRPKMKSQVLRKGWQGQGFWYNSSENLLLKSMTIHFVTLHDRKLSSCLFSFGLNYFLTPAKKG